MQTTTTNACTSSRDNDAPSVELAEVALPAPTSKRRTRNEPEQHDGQDRGNDGSGSNCDEEERACTAPRVRKKSTYFVRKDEIQRLRAEVQALERRANALRGQPHADLDEKALLNMLLREMRHAQQLSFAVAQSAVSSSLSAELLNPLHSSIHLSKDWTERRQTLVGMHEDKIGSAVEYVRARSQLLAPCAARHSEEQFETAGGEFCSTRFDVIPFEDAASVRQVFDALVAYSLDLEIRVSEQLGHITVREDYDRVGASIQDFRLLSTNCDVQVEGHVVLFAKYYESHELSDGAPCAVILMDTVDDDELYPYYSTERVRVDVTQAMVLTAHARQTSDGGSDETVVVLRVAKFLKLHRAEFPVSSRALQSIRNSMCWTPVMAMTINEVLQQDRVDGVQHG